MFTAGRGFTDKIRSRWEQEGEKLNINAQTEGNILFLYMHVHVFHRLL